MTTTDDSYYYLLAEYRKRDNYDLVFRTTLVDLAGKLDLKWVRSCVAFGTGSGEHEIEFIRHLLPNLSEIIAVDPDHESIKALRSNFENAQFPGLKTTITEASLENWNGTAKPVDLALFFNIIYHVESAPRQQLLHKLRTQYLNPHGAVIIIENGSPDTSGYIRLMKRLGYPQDNWYRDIEKEVVACGFRVDEVHDIVSTRDLSQPTEGVLKYVALLFDNAISLDTIHAAIDEIYGDHDPTVKHIVKKMAIFKNGSQI